MTPKVIPHIFGSLIALERGIELLHARKVPLDELREIIPEMRKAARLRTALMCLPCPASPRRAVPEHAGPGQRSLAVDHRRSQRHRLVRFEQKRRRFKVALAETVAAIGPHQPVGCDQVANGDGVGQEHIGRSLAFVAKLEPAFGRCDPMVTNGVNGS